MPRPWCCSIPWGGCGALGSLLNYGPLRKNRVPPMTNESLNINESLTTLHGLRLGCSSSARPHCLWLNRTCLISYEQAGRIAFLALPQYDGHDEQSNVCTCESAPTAPLRRSKLSALVHISGFATRASETRPLRGKYEGQHIAHMYTC